MKQKKHIFAYQARIRMDEKSSAAMDAYAELYGKVERKLYAESLAKNISPNTFKNQYLVKFGISARFFNAVKIGLEGKAKSIVERRDGLIKEAESRVSKATKVSAKLEKSNKANVPFKLHQKKRRLSQMQSRLSGMISDKENSVTRIAFGSKKLFRSQFNLEANNYSSHSDWLNDWQKARSNEIYIVGSQDETAGCQLCVATVDGENSLSLRVRLPDALAGFGKHINLTGVKVNYGFGNIQAALASSEIIRHPALEGKTKRVGSALTYRFKKDGKGWVVFVATDVGAPKIISRKECGAIGVDFNADHLAVAVADSGGNLVDFQRIDVPVVGKTAHQRAANFGDAIKQVIAVAVERKSPIVIEKLDFSKKKSELETVDAKRSKIISALAYRQFDTMLRAAAFRAGIQVIAVNPAYTSTIGAVNYAQRYGVSVHIAAAFAIARRGLKFSEKPIAEFSLYNDANQGVVVAPVRNGGHVTFPLPARNREKHVWSQWSAIRSKLLVAHQEHYRSGKHKTYPARLLPSLQIVGATRYSKAEFLCANRQHNCSVDVLTDVPW